MSTVKVCVSVTIPTSAIYRGRNDPPNLVGIVTDICDNEPLSVKAGQLNVKYSVIKLMTTCLIFKGLDHI